MSNPDIENFGRRFAKTCEAIATEFKVLARTKKLEPAPASDFPELARIFGVKDPTEDIRVRLKDFLERLKAIEDEETEEGEEPLRLAQPVMALLGFTPRTEYEGIGARQRLSARLRYIEPTSMRRHEAKMALDFIFCAVYILRGEAEEHPISDGPTFLDKEA